MNVKSELRKLKSFIMSETFDTLTIATQNELSRMLRKLELLNRKGD